MALTTSVGGFIGPFFVSNVVPTQGDIGGPVQTGMCYIDSDGSSDSFCCYDGSTWKCAVLSSALPTTTSTTTTTSTSSSTTTSTSTSAT